MRKPKAPKCQTASPAAAAPVAPTTAAPVACATAATTTATPKPTTQSAAPCGCTGMPKA